MQNPYVGDISIFGFNFVPVGWAACNGQLLSISEYAALFNLIGTTYGGDGVSTFGLPDLQGRLPIHFGQGVGLSNYVMGQNAGTENATLTVQNLPAHTHTINATNDLGNTSNASGAFPANTNMLDMEYTTSVANSVTMAPQVVSNTGGNLPVSLLQPIVAINFCISLFGVFPTQS